ncbi:MAG TPA: Grx4 family monothiol glutaredoxin [Planctomycetota bacterium]|nr:Grx4 family monothiol glutaredoxin [Planctomycetota bacterium]
MTDQTQAFDKIKAQLAKDKVVVYMKGTKEFPRCGFSHRACEVLKAHGKPFASYDVLSDEELWNHLDEFSGWPTFPQVFVDGKLVGGCDIVVEMHENGELASLLQQSFGASA